MEARTTSSEADATAATDSVPGAEELFVFDAKEAKQKTGEAVENP